MAWRHISCPSGFFPDPHGCIFDAKRPMFRDRFKEIFGFFMGENLWVMVRRGGCYGIFFTAKTRRGQRETGSFLMMVWVPADLTPRPRSPFMESGSNAVYLDFGEPAVGAAGCWRGRKFSSRAVAFCRPCFFLPWS